MGFPGAIKFQCKKHLLQFFSIHCKNSEEGKGSWHLTTPPHLSGEKFEQKTVPGGNCERSPSLEPVCMAGEIQPVFINCSNWFREIYRQILRSLRTAPKVKAN